MIPYRSGLAPFTVILGWLGLGLILMVSVYVLSRSAGEAVPVASGEQVAGGDPANGPVLLRTYCCVACHRVEGMREATGAVGPDLTHFPRRAVIAGRLANTPANLVHWIRFPQEVAPGSAMPDLGVPEQHARDIAAFLYSLE